MMQTKPKLRQVLIQKRLQLSKDELINSSQALAEIALSNIKLAERLTNAKYILSYSSFNNEISAQFLIQKLTANLFLPKIVDYQNKVMHFFPAEQPQIGNKYGITEPSGDGESQSLDLFDIIFVPLVGFDQQCNRLGMGGGFYDKALRIRDISKNKPLFVGLAHDFQEIMTLQPDAWDIPLDVILTNRKIIDPSNNLQSN